MRFWKLLHLAAMAALAGAVLAALLLARGHELASPDVLAAQRAGIERLSSQLALPALLLLLASGAMLIVQRPAHLGARWVWAKVALAVAMTGITLGVLHPANGRAAALALLGAQGSPVLAPLDAALATGQAAAITVLVLLALALAVALWRPRLGQRE